MDPYQPTKHAPWNRQRVVHLHRRAGFAATSEELQRDLDDGPERAIERLLGGTAGTTGVRANFEEMSTVIGDAAIEAQLPNRLKAWWLYRMLFSPDALTERLTLMWHNHFATSNQKVRDVEVMYRQNGILRDGALRRFDLLLSAVIKDAAMLVWLDADSNRRQHPNENLARELMELFTLGVGHYSEDDVKQAARALTGWSSKNGKFRNVPAFHDPGEKQLLGVSGKLDGDQVLQILLGQPATARRLAWRLCDTFFGEQAINDRLIEQLAIGLREHDLDLRWGVETILRSEAFFAENNLGNRVLEPVQFVVGAFRALEMFDQPPSTLVASEWTARLGQDLFYPPNVFGWPGGRDWISTRSMLSRAAFAESLAGGRLTSDSQPLELAHVTSGAEGLALVRKLSELLVVRSNDAYCQKIFDATYGAKDPLVNDRPAQLIVETILASPEAQLG